MHVWVELWTPNAAWRALPHEERRAFMARMADITEPLIQNGPVESLGWGRAQHSADHRAPYDFFAVWRAETEPPLMELRAAVREAGWYVYFDQVNVGGELVPPKLVIQDHCWA